MKRLGDTLRGDDFERTTAPSETATIGIADVALFGGGVRPSDREPLLRAASSLGRSGRRGVAGSRCRGRAEVRRTGNGRDPNSAA